MHRLLEYLCIYVSQCARACVCVCLCVCVNTRGNVDVRASSRVRVCVFDYFMQSIN